MINRLYNNSVVLIRFISRNSNPGCGTYSTHISPPVSVIRLKRTHTSGNSGSFEDEHQARGRNFRIPTTTTSSTSILIQNQIIQNVQFKQESEGMVLKKYGPVTYFLSRKIR